MSGREFMLWRDPDTSLMNLLNIPCCNFTTLAASIRSKTLLWIARGQPRLLYMVLSPPVFTDCPDYNNHASLLPPPLSAEL